VSGSDLIATTHIDQPCRAKENAHDRDVTLYHPLNCPGTDAHCINQRLLLLVTQ